MARIKLLESGFDVEPLRAALAEHPYMWDQNRGRTQDPASPHHGLSDIWCRFAPPGAGGNVPHESVWYPPADDLPVQPICETLMQHYAGEQLGGVLLTRIPAGGICKPHRDLAWHAEFYDKFAVQIEADLHQTFRFEGEALTTVPGDVFWFDNAHTHWVTNPSPVDRVTLIVCIRSALARAWRQP